MLEICRPISLFFFIVTDDGINDHIVARQCWFFHVFRAGRQSRQLLQTACDPTTFWPLGNWTSEDGCQVPGSRPGQPPPTWVPWRWLSRSIKCNVLNSHKSRRVYHSTFQLDINTSYRDILFANTYEFIMLFCVLIRYLSCPCPDFVLHSLFWLRVALQMKFRVSNIEHGRINIMHVCIF